MRAYNIGTIVMIVVLAIFTCIIVGRLLWLGLRKKSKVEFKNYIKTYKFGKFLWVYILAIPLFAMSYHYSGCNGFDCFFKAFTSASKLFVLQFDVSLELAQVNELYRNTIIFCYFIAILNLVLFVSSCVTQLAWNGIARFRFLYSRGDKCLIIGNNPKNEIFYNSINKKTTKRIITAEVLDKPAKWDLYTKNIHYRGSNGVDDLQQYIKKLLEKFDKKFAKARKHDKLNKKFPKFRIIINDADATKNDNMCTFLSNLISSYAIKNKKNPDDKIINYLPYLDVYIYTNKERESLYSNFKDEFSGCLHLVKEQEVIAIDFIEKYPLAKFLTNEQIDYDTCLLEDDTNISVSFVGFGKTQQEIFKLLYSHSQFVKNEGDNIVGLEVEYNIYDKTDTWNNPDFKYHFNRYKDDHLKKNKKNYYPLPQMNKPAFIKANIDSDEFSKLSLQELDKHKEGNNLKYVVISLGNDFASIDYANKLWSKIKEKEITNCHLFVKINDMDSYQNITHIFNDRKNKKLNISCNVYGCLFNTAYNYENIIMNDMTNLGIMADALYNCATTDEYKDRKFNLESNLFEEARTDWSYKKEFNRYSSLCAVLNLRSKLLCMGYDYAKETDESRDELFATYKDYWNALDKNPKYQPKLTNGPGNGVKYLRFASSIDYYFKSDSRRWALVTLEHNRWVANERCKGTTPYPKANVKNKGEYKIKEKGGVTNACMTTMKGLQKLQEDLLAHWIDAKKYKAPYSKKVVRELNKKLPEFDMIKLDSLNIDAAWHILKKVGYKIVAKEAIDGSEAN